MARKRGARIPDPVNPPGTRKLVICVPDSVEWLSLVTGCMAQMTFGWYWDRSTGDLDAVRDRAKQMYFEMQEQNGLCDVIDCEEVADCIETSDAVRDALLQFVNETWDGSIPGTGEIPESVKAENLLNLSGACDTNKAWGNALNIVQSLNRRNVDFLETVAAATNNQEAVAFIVGAIPILETLPIDEMVVIANKVQAWIKESYEAGYDLDYELERACDIFCLIVSAENCELTFEQLRDFYWAKAQEIAIFEDAFDSALTIIGAWANWDETFGEIVVDIMSAMQFGFLNFLNSGFGFAFKQFKTQANAGVPDDDWTVNCDDCPAVWGHTIDFEEEDGDFTAYSTNGKWTEFVGWEVLGSPHTNTILIQRTLPAGTYTRIKVVGDEAPEFSSGIQVRTDIFPSGSVINQQVNQPGTAEVTINGSWVNPPALFINYSKTSSTGNSGYTGKLKSITFTGTGDNPFI